jgi:lysophospholipase
VDAAPLISTARAPLPPGAQGFWFAGAGGARLRAALMPAQAPPRGSVTISPGRTEPIEKYFETAAELQARGYGVLIHDWRGQGLSQRLLADRRKGHAGKVEDFLEDFRLLMDAMEDRLPAPRIMLGHSMGGSLNALSLARPHRFAAALLTAPMMGLAAVSAFPPGVARRIAWGMTRAGRGDAYVLGDRFDPMRGPFAGNGLTHDEARYERFRGQLAACPDLALGGVTWGWLLFALDACAALARPGPAEGIDIPLTLLGAGEDRLVLNGPARRFARRAPHGAYAEIAGAHHELLMETDAVRARVWRAFEALAARV